jgi:hypothetical protein
VSAVRENKKKYGLVSMNPAELCLWSSLVKTQCDPRMIARENDEIG